LTLAVAPYGDLQQLGQAILTWMGAGLAVLAGWVLLLLARTMQRLPDAVDRIERVLERLTREAEALEGLGGHVREAGARLGDAAGDLARVTGAAADTTRKIQERLAEPVIEGVVVVGLQALRRGKVLAAGFEAAGRSLLARVKGARTEPRVPIVTTPAVPESGHPPQRQ
jgi:hypothetical protein